MAGYLASWLQLWEFPDWPLAIMAAYLGENLTNSTEKGCGYTLSYIMVPNGL